MQPAQRAPRRDSDHEARQEREPAGGVREGVAPAPRGHEAGRVPHGPEPARPEGGAFEAQMAMLSARLAARDAEGAVAVETVRVAFEQMRAGAEALAAHNGRLERANAELERQLAERDAALAAADARLSAVTRVAPNLTWASGPVGRWTWASPLWEEFTGVPEEASRGDGWLRCVHPDDRVRTMAAWVEAERTGELRVEHRLRRADGDWRWFSTRAAPVRGRGGAAGADQEGPGKADEEEWIGTSADVDEVRRMADALRDSEARFRGFAEATPDVFWIADARTGGIAYLSPAFEEVWGEAPARLPAPGGSGGEGGRWLQALHPDDRTRALALHEGALHGARGDGEYRIRRPSDGAVRWIHDVAFPVRDPGGAVRFAAGVARDVTERKDSEERHDLLLRELDHRVKNALAVAQSLAAHTARTATSPHAFASAFTDRLRAFGRAQDLLTGNGGAGALLLDVVEATLAPHGAPHDGDGGRISREGPPVRLSPAATISLQMALHELATNAARHGALSLPEGRVRVEWRAEPGGGLALTWEERDGPPVAPRPARCGFGARLIEQAVPRQLGGEARLEFLPAGLRCVVRMPLTAQVRLEAA